MEHTTVDTKVGGGKMDGGVTNGEGRMTEGGTTMEGGDGSGNHKVSTRRIVGTQPRSKLVWEQ